MVILSSGAHLQAPDGGIAFDNLDGKKGYADWKFYGQSKFANILFAKELAKKLKGKQTANALHPGVIATNLRPAHELRGARRARGRLGDRDEVGAAGRGDADLRGGEPRRSGHHGRVLERLQREQVPRGRAGSGIGFSAVGSL